MTSRIGSPWPVAAATLAVAVSVASFAGAAVPLLNTFGGPRGFGTHCLSPNDDGSSARIDLTPYFPAGLHFFSATHTSAYVNTNGNITFSGAVPIYTPEAFPVASRPMIAAYWADVDLRPLVDRDCRGLGAYTSEPGDGPCENPPSNGAWWYLEPGRWVITWDQVGYYSCHLDRRMSFQMIITAAPPGCGVAPGDFDVEFRFERCEWTTGDASGGSGGFGGFPAQVGFDAGDSVNYVEVPGSRTGSIHTICCDDSNVGEPGVWRWQIRSGTIICPDAGDPCTVPGALGVCAEGRTQCVADDVICVGNVSPSPERCDALDNDCDGAVDEDDGICAPFEICDHGVCRTVCSEFGCPPGQICDDDGRCIDEECRDVVCDEGLRCVDGVCVGACDGIVCPWDRVCVAGNCVDLCAVMVCDECSTCIHGVCETRCEWEPCPPGEVCQADGRCLPEPCLSVTCDPGFHCEGGTCVDNCLGAVCPAGQECRVGECVPIPTGADAAPGADADAAPGADADAAPGADADAAFDMSGDARPDAWTVPPADTGEGLGCGCRAVSAPTRASPAAALLALAGLALAPRRRR